MNKKDQSVIGLLIFPAAMGAVALLLMLSSCAGNHCRADGRLPQDKSFDELRDLKREQCQ